MGADPTPEALADAVRWLRERGISAECSRAVEGSGAHARILAAYAGDQTEALEAERDAAVARAEAAECGVVVMCTGVEQP